MVIKVKVGLIWLLWKSTWLLLLPLMAIACCLLAASVLVQGLVLLLEELYTDACLRVIDGR